MYIYMYISIYIYSIVFLWWCDVSHSRPRNPNAAGLQLFEYIGELKETKFDANNSGKAEKLPVERTMSQ